MEAFIELRDVRKTYVRGKFPVEVLRGIDLSIHKGEFVALMGPSGSGKTTLLNMLGGLDAPDSGSLRIEGQAVGAMTETQRAHWRAASVGFVFQSFNLLPMLTAQSNVELPLMLTNLSGKQRHRFSSIALQLVGLADRASHKPSELSGGQQQRVAIARAIVSDPKLILCDEPTGDLDREAANEVMELLGQLNKQRGTTILMVTHDQVAADCAGRLLRLEKGDILSGAVTLPLAANASR